MEETNGIHKQVYDKDALFKKTKADLDKVRKHRDCLENRIPSLTKNLDDLTKLVEK
jgi:hypothetical protein